MRMQQERAFKMEELLMQIKMERKKNLVDKVFTL